MARKGPSSDRELPRRDTSSDRERPDPRPNKEATAKGEREKPPVVVTSRDGASVSSTVAPALQLYSNRRMTNLVSTGGPTSLCYQLYTEGGVAAWKQTAVPNRGHSYVLLMPVKRMPHPDRVDPAAKDWQGSTWPPAAPAAAKQTGVTEVVLRGVTREADGRNREVVLFTDKATGRQTVRIRFQTNGEELSAEESSRQGQVRPRSQRSPRSRKGRTRRSKDREEQRGAIGPGVIDLV